ncbi:unnamed protein product [Psylliodes chrysocephalus]|uniref:Uncharacterized protein n=1 Tax=Psylliodes chrysocephalus TaxID=3402493 RepID=A0A9P0CNX2_9CUCU|nr:unnamed protein product [Psylliodes chrysocephala]
MDNVSENKKIISKVIRTFKKKIPCPAFVALRVSQNGKFLEVKSLNNNHNHKTRKALSEFFPQQRKWPYENREEAKMLLMLDANKKRVREKLEKDTSLKLTLKDLSNSKQSATNKALIGIDQCVDILKNKYDCEVSILKECLSKFPG